LCRLLKKPRRLAQSGVTRDMPRNPAFSPPARAFSPFDALASGRALTALAFTSTGRFLSM